MALGCETVVVPGAGVPMPEQQPERFAQLVLDPVARAWPGSVRSR